MQTVLALPRPQLHPVSEQDAAEKAGDEPAASWREEQQPPADALRRPEAAEDVLGAGPAEPSA